MPATGKAEHGAGIFNELAEAEAKIAVKREIATVLRQAMVQEGLSGITAYFAIREEIVSLEAAAEAARRKLEGYLEACGG